MSRTVLFISSSPDQAVQLAPMLTPLDIDLRVVESLAGLTAVLDDSSVGVVITESQVRDADWHLILSTVRRRAAIQTLVTQNVADAHFWTDALEAGAYDIITQPFHPAEVQRLVLSAWLKFELLRADGVKMAASSTPALAARAAG